MFQLTKKRIAAGVITALLATGIFGMTAGATGTGTNPNPEIEEFKIQKTLVMDDNVKTYPKLEFTFQFTQLTTQTEIAAAIKEGPGTGVTNLGSDETIGKLIAAETKNLDDVKISYDSNTDTGRTTESVGGGTAAAAKIVKTENIKASGNNLSAGYFGAPGFYVYKVTENVVKLAAPSESGGGVNQAITAYDELTCSKAEYLLVIPVGWKEGNIGEELTFVMEDAVILQTKNDAGEQITPVKVSVPNFSNTYQRNDEKPTSYGLEVKKMVQGKYADTEQEFEFTITIGRNATEADNVVGYAAKIYDADGNEITTSGNEAGRTNLFAEFGTPMSFKLKHGEELRFEKFPVGTTWKLSETETGNYRASAEVIAGGTKETNAAITGDSVTTQTIEEGSNRADVTNTLDEITVTGIVTDNLSFILLIAVAVAGIAAYTVMKRRLRNR